MSPRSKIRTMAKMTKLALVTGGAGFIGSHVADRLLDRGFRVRILDSLVEQVHGSAECDGDGWPNYLDPRIERIRGSVLDTDTVRKSLSGVTHLVHLAAAVGVGQSMTDILGYTHNNVMGAAAILQVLRDGGHSVERVAVASSMAIYGEGACRDPETGEMVSPPPRPFDQLRAKRWEYEAQGRVLEPIATTEAKPLDPGTIYAIGKRDHEEMFLVVGRALGIPTIALRLFNVYGSRQALSNPYAGFAAICISRLLNNSPPILFEDGGMRRDFVHVTDVANAFALVLERDDPMWDCFNVGNGGWVTIGQVAERLIGLLGSRLEPVVLKRARIGDVRHCFADNGKFTRQFDFAPSKPIDEGLAELVDWVRRVRNPDDSLDDAIESLERSGLLI